jgi:GH24 family phage-related lysozyme (muramidase)
LLEAASANKDWNADVAKKWPGPHEVTYLMRGTAFKDKFEELKKLAVPLAKEAIAAKKYSKEFAKLEKAKQDEVEAAATQIVNEQATVLAKTTDAVFKEDLMPFEKTVRAAVTVQLLQAEYDALISFAFNVGPKACRESSLVKEINKDKWRNGDAKERKASIEAIEKAFVAWNKSNGKVSDGLTRRRKREADEFLAKARRDLTEFEKKGAPAAAGAPAPAAGPPPAK